HSAYGWPAWPRISSQCKHWLPRCGEWQTSTAMTSGSKRRLPRYSARKKRFNFCEMPKSFSEEWGTKQRILNGSAENLRSASNNWFVTRKCIESGRARQTSCDHSLRGRG